LFLAGCQTQEKLAPYSLHSSSKPSLKKAVKSKKALKEVPLQKGEKAITVKAGQTLYSIARDSHLLL